MTLTPPPFNPEEMARYKVKIGLDLIFRWADALASARGSLEGVNAAFKRQRGREIEELTVEVENLREVMAEMVEEMKKGMINA